MKDHIIAAVNIAPLIAVAGFLIRALYRDRHPAHPVPLRLRARWRLRCRGTRIQRPDPGPRWAARFAEAEAAFWRKAGPEALAAEETARFYARQALGVRDDR